MLNMFNKPELRLLACVLALTLLTSARGVSEDDDPRIPKLGQSVNLDAKDPAANITLALPRPGSEAILCGIKIEPAVGSSPRSYILSGRVKSDNTGIGLERIALFVGGENQAPRLAAMTNSDGDFKFRLWVKQPDRRPTLQVPPDFSGFLYVGGHPSLTYRNRLRLMSGYSIRYRLTELAEKVEVKIVAQQDSEVDKPKDAVE